MYHWGYEHLLIIYSQQVATVSTAAKQVIYNHSYSRSVGYQGVMLWGNNTTMEIDTGKNDTALRVGSTSYVDGIEFKHPGYVHYLYHYSINTYGTKSGFKLLSTAMNQKSDAPSEQIPTKNVSKQQLNT